MLDLCFRHQHPELFGGLEINQEFPKESGVRAEQLPDGANAEGYVWSTQAIAEKGRFSDYVLAAAAANGAEETALRFGLPVENIIAGIKSGFLLLPD